MNIKKELIVGIIGVIAIVATTLFYINKYNVSKQSLVPTQSQIEKKPSSPTPSSLTQQAVSNHNSENDCWIIIRQSVYNVTSYITLHPGGADKIIMNCGKDATQEFESIKGGRGHSERADQTLENLKVGDLQ